MRKCWLLESQLARKELKDLYIDRSERTRNSILEIVLCRYFQVENMPTPKTLSLPGNQNWAQTG